MSFNQKEVTNFIKGNIAEVVFVFLARGNGFIIEYTGYQYRNKLSTIGAKESEKKISPDFKMEHKCLGDLTLQVDVKYRADDCFVWEDSPNNDDLIIVVFGNRRLRAARLRSIRPELEKHRAALAKIYLGDRKRYTNLPNRKAKEAREEAARKIEKKFCDLSEFPIGPNHEPLFTKEASDDAQKLIAKIIPRISA